MLNKRNIGKTKEELAAAFLQSKGVKVITKNYQCRHAEIDIIALDKDILIFVEVKYRSNTKHGNPYEAVSPLKQKKISTAALYFLMNNRSYLNLQKRFDIISILGNKLNWIKAAFEFQGNSLF